MNETALFIRGANASEMVKLLQADRLTGLAMQIADETARSDVEIYAGVVIDADDVRWYDLKRPADAEDPPEDLAKANRAIAYINARGPIFPWALVTHGTYRHQVRFEDPALARQQESV